MRLPVTKKLNERDTLAFLLHASILQRGDDPREHAIICRFCDRVGINRHDYAIATRDKTKWADILEVLKRKELITL